MSTRCVSVNAPGYGYYDGATNHGGRNAKVRKVHKDISRVASTAKSDPTTVAPAPAVDAAPAKPAEPAPQALPSDTPPAK
jgi:hypothetical protein